MFKPKAILSLVGFFLVAGIIFSMIQENERYERNLVDYQVPSVTLLNQHAQPVALTEYLNCGKPVMLEFVFTSCTTLCPNQSVKFSNFQKRLHPDTEQVRLVSISVDPETDTPAVVKSYLQKYHAAPGWDFLTGSRGAIEKVMQAFGIKPSDMITQDSSLLLRSPATGQWIRIDGQLESQDFVREYHLIASSEIN